MTEQKLKNIVSNRDNVSVMKSLFEAIAYEETIRSIIEPMQQEIVDSHRFKIAPEWVARGIRDSIFVTTPSDMYLASKGDQDLYFKELENGYIKVRCLPSKKGNCPLLEAESLVRDVKIEVANHFESQIGISYNDISWSLSKYKTYYDLLLTMFAQPVKEMMT